MKYELSYEAHFREDEGIIMHSQFEPAIAGYKEKVISSLNRQKVMKEVNASILAIRPCEIEKVSLVN